MGGTGADDVWAVGRGGSILHHTAGGWSPVSKSITDAELTALWADTPSNVWTAGAKGNAFRWDGQNWTPSPTGLATRFNKLWGSGPNDIWAAGSPTSARWNGTGWTEVADAGLTEMDGVWGFSSQDVYGSYVSTEHWNGASWSPVGGLGAGCLDVWGSASNDVWAVGNEGDVGHWKDSTWTTELLPTIGVSQRLEAIHGSAANNVWIAGTGAMWHYDGTGWKPTSGEASNSMVGVHVASMTEAWAVDFLGHIARWDGTVWKREESGTDNALHTIWATDTDVWAVGLYGTILRRHR
jgi:hypothetical protein